MQHRTTTIELNRDTHSKLVAIKGVTQYANKDGDTLDRVETFDTVINRLLCEHEEVMKYIDDYIRNSNGNCINETMFSRGVIANHNFDSSKGTCIKCGWDGIVEIHNKK